MNRYFIGKTIWESGNDEEYQCSVCSNTTWYDKYEKKRLEMEYGYSGIACCKECRENSCIQVDGKDIQNN